MFVKTVVPTYCYGKKSLKM